MKKYLLIGALALTIITPTYASACDTARDSQKSCYDSGYDTGYRVGIGIGIAIGAGTIGLIAMIVRASSKNNVNVVETYEDNPIKPMLYMDGKELSAGLRYTIRF